MEKVIIEIDKDGYYIQDIIINTDYPQYPTFYTETRLPADAMGNQLPFFKPRWTGVEWVEGMTQDEIDELRGQSQELTEINALSAKVSTLEEENMSLMLASAEMYEAMYEENMNLMLAVAELYEIIMGGAVE